MRIVATIVWCVVFVVVAYRHLTATPWEGHPEGRGRGTMSHAE
jgi:hypothetical protein